MGDAAHPFQPHVSSETPRVEMARHANLSDMGQGAAMAIEDAVSLAVLLPLGTTVANIPSRLALYEQARRERVETILEYTRINGRNQGDVSAKIISRKF